MSLDGTEPVGANRRDRGFHFEASWLKEENCVKLWRIHGWRVMLGGMDRWLIN
jgi:hypothetical protein